jgi:hypothetical protein
MASPELPPDEQGGTEVGLGRLSRMAVRYAPIASFNFHWASRMTARML